MYGYYYVKIYTKNLTHSFQLNSILLFFKENIFGIE